MTPNRSILWLFIFSASIPGSEIPLLDKPGTATSPSIAANEREAYIPHALEVQPFTPPAAKVAPNLEICEIHASVVHQNSKTTTLTLQLGEPSSAPDLPAAPVAQPTKQRPQPTPEQLARYQWHRRHTIQLGATILDHKISILRWSDSETGRQYEAVCGYDASLLEGICRFVYRNETYSLTMMHSNINTTRLGRSWAHWATTLPNVEEGGFVLTKAGPEADNATMLPSMLGKVLEVENDRLLVFQRAREVYRNKAAAWTAANPPQPKSEIFTFRPHRGSRYLKKEGSGK